MFQPPAARPSVLSVRNRSVRPQADPSARRRILNRCQYGGVAVGEHLGQVLTVIFVLMVSRTQWGDGQRLTGGLGAISAVALLAGAHEGLALALGQSGEVFSLATIAGFLGLSAWLVATGLGLMRVRHAQP